MRTISSLILLLLLTQHSISQELSKMELVEDARELKYYIESCHPDPYISIGGKIEFNSEFQKMLKEFPEEGLNIEGFWIELSKFIAKLKDGHTYLYPVKYPNTNIPGGIPIKFKILSDSTLIIEKVPQKN